MLYSTHLKEAPMTAVRTNPRSTAAKRLALLAGAAFVILYTAALWATRSGIADALKVAFSVSALAAFVLFLVAEMRIVRVLDELAQRMQLEALAFAFPLSVALVMLLGLLQRFATLPIEDTSYRHIWPVMILFYVIGVALARRRY
jgi:hypothetical protein